MIIELQRDSQYETACPDGMLMSLALEAVTLKLSLTKYGRLC
jgi:hypothetical protein